MIGNLLLAPDLFQDMLDGHKKVTLRLGHRDIRPGKFTFRSTADERQAADVRVLVVLHSLLMDVPLDCLEAEGFASRDAALITLRRFYPEVTQLSEVTLIMFERL